MVVMHEAQFYSDPYGKRCISVAVTASVRMRCVAEPLLPPSAGSRVIETLSSLQRLLSSWKIPEWL